MSTKTTIEWTRNDDGTAGRTWNPVTGCDKVSPGCDHCYAENIARRFAGSKAFPNGFAVTIHEDRLDQPFRWRNPSRVFVNSMSDLFHEQVPDEFLTRVFDAMEARQNQRHTFQILTKRHARMRSFLRRRMESKREYAAKFDQCPTEAMRNSPAAQWARQWAANPPANIWLGVSVEDQEWAQTRVPALLETPAAVRFLSCEPLLGGIDLRRLERRNRVLIDALSGDVIDGRDGAVLAATPGVVDLVIAGAESGAGAREMDLDWVRSLRDQCVATGRAFFFKQDAVRGKKVPTPELDGRTWTQMPAVA